MESRKIVYKLRPELWAHAYTRLKTKKKKNGLWRAWRISMYPQYPQQWNSPRPPQTAFFSCSANARIRVNSQKVQYKWNQKLWKFIAQSGSPLPKPQKTKEWLQETAFRNELNLNPKPRKFIAQSGPLAKAEKDKRMAPGGRFSQRIESQSKTWKIHSPKLIHLARADKDKRMAPGGRFSQRIESRSKTSKIHTPKWSTLAKAEKDKRMAAGGRFS